MSCGNGISDAGGDCNGISDAGGDCAGGDCIRELGVSEGVSNTGGVQSLRPYLHPDYRWHVYLSFYNAITAQHNVNAHTFIITCGHFSKVISYVLSGALYGPYYVWLGTHGRENEENLGMSIAFAVSIQLSISALFEVMLGMEDPFARPGGKGQADSVKVPAIVESARVQMVTTRMSAERDWTVEQDGMEGHTNLCLQSMAMGSKITAKDTTIGL